MKINKQPLDSKSVAYDRAVSKMGDNPLHTEPFCDKSLLSSSQVHVPVHQNSIQPDLNRAFR